MTVREALRRANASLQRAGVPDAALDARLLLSHLLEEQPMTLALEGEREISPQQLSQFEQMTQRRASRVPLQIILGTTDFMGLSFAVTPDVLIPRQDTEILCEEALRRIGERESSVLDIGTGSGALAVAIAKLSSARVTAVDISPAALSVARENAKRLGARVRFLESDLFSALGSSRFDVIVSNPPYIAHAELGTLMPEVRQEPAIALDGGKDGLDFYRRIVKEANAHIAAKGCILFEIGWQQKDAVSALLQSEIGEPFALRDYGGNWRVVGAVKRDDASDSA